jgi:hypothetical protein
MGRRDLGKAIVRLAEERTILDLVQDDDDHRFMGFDDRMAMFTNLRHLRQHPLRLPCAIPLNWITFDADCTR